MRFEALSGWTSEQRHVVAATLNELSPDQARGAFPDVVYRLGNFIASVNAPMQAWIADQNGGDYALALALVAGTVAVVIAVLTLLGTEAKGIAFGTDVAGDAAKLGLGTASSTV